VISLIREPVIKRKRYRLFSVSDDGNFNESGTSLESEEDDSNWSRMKELTSRVWETSRSDVSYFVAYFGSLIIRLI